MDKDGYFVAEYVYDAWGKILLMKDKNGSDISNNTSHIGYINPIRYRSYYYDVETNLYYLESRYYDPETGRFLNADSLSYLGEGNDLQNYNLYSYCENNPVMYKQRLVSSVGSITTLSISAGSFNSAGGTLGAVESGNPSTPWWASTVVGAIPDFILGMRYLDASGMHSKFAYATTTRYMHPIIGGTWRWFGKSSSNFGTVAQGIFRQILTGDARAGFGAIAKSVGGVVGINALVNFGFNLYENNWQINSAMLKDTAIDTAIGVSSYYLAAGTMSLVTTGLVAAGVSVPGIIVVGGVVILSIGFEHAIRAITGYWD